MDFLNTGVPLGQWWGINVRLHFTFLIYAFWRAQSFGHLGYGLVYVAGLYFCILLHEFGHALAARWCDGEANEILLWPLGGLAYCRPAFHPTAHLITTVAGPFVTLVLWLLFSAISWLLANVVANYAYVPAPIFWFVDSMSFLNRWLLLFNLIPAFPMDGGRILRDSLWHGMSAETATKIAVVVSQFLGVLVIAWALYSHDYWLILIAGFILLQSMHEKAIVGYEAGGAYQFSLRERFRRGSRRRQFHQAVRQRMDEDASQPFHQCAACRRTELDSPDLDFRVCTDCTHGQEYCAEHLHNHTHS